MEAVLQRQAFSGHHVDRYPAPQGQQGNKMALDDTNYFVLTGEDRYGAKVWFYETIAAGWKHWAIILPALQIGKMSITEMVTQYRAAGINAKIFDNVPEAMTWLEAQ